MRWHVVFMSFDEIEGINVSARCRVCNPQTQSQYVDIQTFTNVRCVRIQCENGTISLYTDDAGEPDVRTGNGEKMVILLYHWLDNNQDKNKYHVFITCEDGERATNPPTRGALTAKKEGEPVTLNLANCWKYPDANPQVYVGGFRFPPFKAIRDALKKQPCGGDQILLHIVMDGVE